jgi:hypothetical protein
MDWFERLIGVSPDSGNGGFEALIIIAVATVVALGGTMMFGMRKRPPGD